MAQAQQIPTEHFNDHRELLDLIDGLRCAGLGRYVTLPQVIVTGDQSSGKSSVLEAISGLSFPTEDGFCTRFATEVILRRATEEHIDVTIIPDQERNVGDRDRLANKRWVGVKDLADIIENVTNELKEMQTIAGGNIFEDVLRVEISGPDKPQLSLVDLPGLVVAESKKHSEHDIQAVNRLVDKYMSQERTVIMAVVSAKNDFANQIITTRARKLDQAGARTLGLITKPDTLSAGSTGEGDFLKLAMNQDVKLALGWHVLRNRSYEDTKNQLTLDQRNQQEEKFFRNSAWSKLPSRQLGIVALRTRLSQILKDQIILQLPKVVAETEIQITNCYKELETLGPYRGTLGEQRNYLCKVAGKYAELIDRADQGNYNDSFFSNYENTNGRQRRLRAQIVALKEDFADAMIERGYTERIVDDNAKIGPGGRQIKRSRYLAKVQKSLKYQKGQELPGIPNAAIIGQLFRAQAAGWEGIIQDLREKAIKTAFLVVDAVIQSIADSSTANAILNHLDSSKRILTDKVDTEIKRILKMHMQCNPMTYNQSFTENLRKAQRAAYEHNITSLLARFISSDGTEIHARVDHIIDAISDRTNDPNMDRYSSMQAMYAMEAYYQVALEQITDDICRSVIEGRIMQELKGLFEIEVVNNMSDQTIKAIAGEGEGPAAARARLNEKIDILTSALDELKRYHRYRPTLSTGSGEDYEVEDPARNDNHDISSSDEEDEPSHPDETLTEATTNLDLHQRPPPPQPTSASPPSQHQSTPSLTPTKPSPSPNPSTSSSAQKPFSGFGHTASNPSPASGPSPAIGQNPVATKCETSIEKFSFGSTPVAQNLFGSSPAGHGLFSLEGSNHGRVLKKKPRSRDRTANIRSTAEDEEL